MKPALFLKTITLIYLSLTLTACYSSLSGLTCQSETTTYGNDEFKVNVTTYTKNSRASLAHKSLIIVPPTGGTNIIDRSYGRTFCGADFAVYVLNGWSEDTETDTDIEIHQHFYGQAQKAIHAVLNKITTPFVGILGTSVGALHASIAAATIDRLNAALFIVGGAPIAEIVVNSDQEAMINLRIARSQRYGFKTAEENILAIGKVFSLEPMGQNPTFKNKNIGMVIAEKDLTVPYANQTKLRDFWQPQYILHLSDNHFWAIVKTWLLYSGSLVDFFNRPVYNR